MASQSFGAVLSSEDFSEQTTQSNNNPATPAFWAATILKLLAAAYLFFLSITMMGTGMKSGFKGPVKQFLHDNADQFTELVSFVVGVIGTGLVQSSSTVTSMAVVLTQEGIVPLVISIGIVHGANLGTSVTSSLVAIASEVKPLTGNPLYDLRTILFEKRLPGFHRAVSTAVCHGMFNAVLVTGILLTIELPFGAIHKVAAASSYSIAGYLEGAGSLMKMLKIVAPKTWTKPVVILLSDFGVADWALVIGSFFLLFASLRVFSTSVRAALMSGSDGSDLETIGKRLLGSHPVDTFIRGLLLTILVQSSSATTSMVVPLAALGLFSIRQVFPFIMGANIGTTTTALIAASASLGEEGFEAGMTIALSHFYLNTFAVILVVVVPGLLKSVMGATQILADAAERVPVALVGYLVFLIVIMPAIVYFLPNAVAWGLLMLLVVALLVYPHLYLKKHGERF